MNNRINKAISIMQGAWIDFSSTAKGNPFFLLIPFTYPIALLFVMYLNTGTRYLGLLLVGAILAEIINAGTAVFSETGSSKLFFKTFDLYVASPTSPFVYCMTISASWILMNSLAIFLFLLLALYFTHAGLLAVIATILIAIETSMVLGFIAFSAGTRLKTERDVFALGTILSFGLTLLSPIYYPITVLPPFVQMLSFLFPSTGPAILLQWAFGILNVNSNLVILSIANILVYLIIGIVAVKTALWREE